MSFSIVDALTLLMTLGQIFLNNGEFKPSYTMEEAPQAYEMMRASCKMVMQDEDIKKTSPAALITLLREGMNRYDKKLEEMVQNQCATQTMSFQKTHDPSEKAPECDRSQAILEIQNQLPKLASPIGKQLEIFSDLSMRDAIQLFDFICADQPSGEFPKTISLEKVLASYNKAMSEALGVNLEVFRHPILPQSSLVYSYDGKEVIGEVYKKENRRTWVPLKDIPQVVRQAFVSAEDQNFFTHKGVELRGVLRGFMRYMKDKKIEGGSTLTQQIVKNVVLTNEIKLERKIKEMIIATRLEKVLNKDQILEIYLNLINLGRHSWGVQTAAHNYFGKDKMVSDLGLNEATFFAGITHSPNRYEPEINAANIKERQSYVLRRMYEDGFINETQLKETDSDKLAFVDREVLISSYFHQAVEEDLKKRVNENTIKEGGLFIFSTQIPEIQKVMEASLQDRLWHYENTNGRVVWSGPLGNILKDSTKDVTVEMWSRKIDRFQKLYSDVHWNVGVVLEESPNLEVGLKIDGEATSLPLTVGTKKSGWAADVRSKLKTGDMVFVAVDENKKSASLRVPPKVQGAAVAMEAKTGKVLALVGGFSYEMSQLNRVTNSFRQPGSTVKPFTYLSALQRGFQPDYIVRNAPIAFDPIYIPGEKRLRRNQKCNTWTVSNYSNNSSGSMSLRVGLETSNNRVTARLLKEMYPSEPEFALGFVRNTMMDFGLYENPMECYPVILGADETNLIKLAAAYGAIANGGTLVEPYFIDVTRNAGLLEKLPQQKQIASADPVSLFQLKNIMGGVVRRGTGFALKDFKDLVAGKTGTSQAYNDAWFVGFSNDIVVGVWVGYDNGLDADKRRNLGSAGTGGSLPAPVAKAVFDAAFKIYPPTPLINNPPGGLELVKNGSFVEAFRLGAFSDHSQNRPSIYNEDYDNYDNNIDPDNMNEGQTIDGPLRGSWDDEFDDAGFDFNADDNQPPFQGTGGLY